MTYRKGADGVDTLPVVVGVPHLVMSEWERLLKRRKWCAQALSSF